MRDDVLIIWKKCADFDLNDFKQYLNSLEKRVQWTMELEENNTLAFTDILITRKDDKLITKVFTGKLLTKTNTLIGHYATPKKY